MPIDNLAYPNKYIIKRIDKYKNCFIRCNFVGFYLGGGGGISILSWLSETVLSVLFVTMAFGSCGIFSLIPFFQL
jgi:hypothetical protein